ncbi:hypothetical protein [Butyrivibrio sp. AE2032]|uniref:hypothetical protein n=1 Tax=Butyrivibrio sp. AE2032 TaxID=1458463 RepID=UPI000553C244|nr:hypothetical protein [Butyrivibrio sp. AE2032]
MKFQKFVASALTAGMMLSFVPATAMADSSGWREDEWGWKYYTSDNECYINTWKEIDGYWYYFYEDGYVLKDTFAWIDGDMYHFDAKGHMDKNKWIPCRYFVTGYTDLGAEIYDKTRTQWRYVGSNGKVYSGWKKIGGSWYFFGDCKEGGFVYDYGIMAVRQNYFVGNMTDDYLEYYFEDNGKMLSNAWHKNIWGDWCYYGADGRAYEGWHKINNKWYFFKFDYSMVTGLYYDWETGAWFFDPSGAMNTTPGWHQDPATGNWCYLRSDGSGYRNEWLRSGNKWYYFDLFGRMVSNAKNVVINDKLYDFDKNGVCANPDSGRKITGWKKVSNFTTDGVIEAWVYGDSNGKLYRDKCLDQAGSKYFFDEEGFLITDWNEYPNDGKLYSVDKDGKATMYGTGKTGWVKTSTGWIYIDSDGKFSTEWKKMNGNWYYFNGYNGVTVPNSFWSMYDDPSIEYYFDGDCKMVTGWFQDGSSWYYSGSDGRVYMGRWLNYRGSWYYFYRGWGAMLENVYHFVIDGRGYDFDENGKCINPDNPAVVIVEDYIYE